MAKIENPGFESHLIAPDFGIDFDASLVGPGTYMGLRKESQVGNHQMSTLPQLGPWMYAAFNNKEVPGVNRIRRSFSQKWIATNTAVYRSLDGFFVKDNPPLKDGWIHMDPNELENELGSYEANGVVYSDDRRIRFTPSGFKEGKQSTKELIENRGTICFTGSPENAEYMGLAMATKKGAYPALKILPVEFAGTPTFTGFRFLERPTLITDYVERNFNRFFTFRSFNKNRETPEAGDIRIMNLSSLLPSNDSYDDRISQSTQSTL